MIMDTNKAPKNNGSAIEKSSAVNKDSNIQNKRKNDKHSERDFDETRWDQPQQDIRKQPGYRPDKDPNLNPSSNKTES